MEVWDDYENLNGKYNNPPTFHSPSVNLKVTDPQIRPPHQQVWAMADQLPWGDTSWHIMHQVCLEHNLQNPYKSIYIYKIPKTSLTFQVRFLARARYEKDSKQQKTSKGNDVHITQVVIDSPLSQCRMGF